MKFRTSNWIKRGMAFALLLALAPTARPVIDVQPHTAVVLERPTPRANGTPEEMIVAAIDAVRDGRYREAQATVDRLLEKEPNYRLAHLLRADLYAMRAMPLTSIGGAAKGPADRLEDLRHEALVRIQRHASPPPVNTLPGNLLVFAPRQKYAVLVDTSVSRLYVFRNENGEPKLERDHYVTIGKLGANKLREGDQRTPIGVYFVTGHMPRPQLDKTYGAAKADLYGVGAWPISYPNEWDKREGRTGHGIWLHGSPSETYARAPQASNGCVVLTNPEMEQIAGYLQTATTPVVITERVNWMSRQEWKAQQSKTQAQILAWHAARENPASQRWAGYYSRQFQSKDGQGTDADKRPVTTATVKTQLEDLSVFSTGGQDPMLVSSFAQEIPGNGQMKKRLYWKQEAGAWRIVWEGLAEKGA